MAASREEVAERVKEVLVEQLGADANAITLGAPGAAGNVVERVAARLEEEVAGAPH